MIRTFEPSYPHSVELAVSMSPELQGVLVSPDQFSPDITTTIAIDNDVVSGKMHHGHVVSHSVGEVVGIAEETDFSVRQRFGDAVVDGLFISDLLDVARSKPVAATFDQHSLLRGVLLALDRDLEADSFPTLWQNIGLNFQTVYVVGLHVPRSEASATTLMRDVELDSAEVISPWFVRFGFATEDNTRQINTRLRQRNVELKSISAQDDEAGYPEKNLALFDKGQSYQRFLDVIKLGYIDQPSGFTLENYLDSGGVIDPATYYIDAIDDKHLSDIDLLLTSRRPFTVGGCENRVLFHDAKVGYVSSLVAGRFIVQTTTSFLPHTKWLKVSELAEDGAEQVREIVSDIEAKKQREQQMESIF